MYNLGFRMDADTNRHCLPRFLSGSWRILPVALIARFLLHRMIDRATTGRARKGRSADASNPLAAAAALPA